MGSPARLYFLDIDTGSDLAWVQCDAPCTSCAKVMQSFNIFGYFVYCLVQRVKIVILDFQGSMPLDNLMLLLTLYLYLTLTRSEQTDLYLDAVTIHYHLFALENVMYIDKDQFTVLT